MWTKILMILAMVWSAYWGAVKFYPLAIFFTLLALAQAYFEVFKSKITKEANDSGLVIFTAVFGIYTCVSYFLKKIVF